MLENAPALIVRLVLKNGEAIVLEGPWPGTPTEAERAELLRKATEAGEAPPQLPPIVSVGHIVYQGAMEIKTFNYDDNGELVEEVTMREQGYYLVASDSEINGRFLSMRVAEDMVFMVDESLLGDELASRILDIEKSTEAEPAAAPAPAPQAAELS